MTTYKDLCDKAKSLSASLKSKQSHAVPLEIIAQACVMLDHLLSTLAPFFAASAQEKKAAKSHPTASQITRFTTADSDRKRYFNRAYFQEKFRDLPAEERRLVVSSTPTTLAGFRDALITYYYRTGLRTGQDLLKELQIEMETEYHNLPHVIEHNRLKSLYREVLLAKKQEDVVSRLSAALEGEKDVSRFAKANKLKIPAAKRGKNVLHTTLLERLAEVIFKKGALVRLDL